MLLAQQAPVMLLDEPTTYLDVSHQLEVLELVRGLEPERSVAPSFWCCTISTRRSSLPTSSSSSVRDRSSRARTPQQVMTGGLLRTVFGIEARILHDPELTAPVIVPLTSVANTR